MSLWEKLFGDKKEQPAAVERDPFAGYSKELNNVLETWAEERGKVNFLAEILGDDYRDNYSFRIVSGDAFNSKKVTPDGDVMIRAVPNNADKQAASFVIEVHLKDGKYYGSQARYRDSVFDIAKTDYGLPLELGMVLIPKEHRLEIDENQKGSTFVYAE